MIRYVSPLIILLTLLVFSVPLQAQNDNSNRRFLRWGKHTGNLVETPFLNNGNVADGYWGPSQRQRWPIGSGTVYGHTMSFYVAAEVLTDNGQSRYIVSESYNRSGGDTHPSGSHKFQWQPLPGFYNMNPINDNAADRAHLTKTGKYYIGGINEDVNGNGELDQGEDLNLNGRLDGELENNIEYPAMSHLPETWPRFWPPQTYPGDDRSLTDIRPGSRASRWNGQYGAYVRGDQESYYVMDDRDNDEFDYYPFNLPNGQQDRRAWREGGRRGLGLEVTVRQYQWNNVLAEDILISTYDVKNVSSKSIPKTVVGMLVDFDIGNRTSGNRAFYDTVDNITYQWHTEGLSNTGLPTGYAAVAFLQSPGNNSDGIDNDRDGMVDESQQDGIDNDGDWRIWEDINNNGVFDIGIDLIWDDTGSDGLGPEDEGYPGPDPDGTESNGRPDLGEPNFEFTDNDEIDQIGLTSTYISFPTNIQNDLYNDEQFWRTEVVPGTFVVPQETNDIMYVYGCGYVAIDPGQSERFAIAILNGNDFADILRNKRTMQNIYDSDYNFTKAPNRPFVTAIPGNRKVTLIWDNSSERSRDPIYGMDFAMYKVYRSTEPDFNDIKTISDAYGNPILWKPIAQFDLNDGLTGAHPIPIGDFGVSYDMGDDSGLKHSLVDSNLTNGRTYYYAVVSVDKGYDNDFFSRGLTQFANLTPISPTESSKIIQVDPLGRPTFIDRNAAVVVPVEPAAGYVVPALMDGIERMRGDASGSIKIDLLNPDELKPDNRYRLTFNDNNKFENIDSTFKTGLTSSFTFTNITTNSILYEGDSDFESSDLEVALLEGMKLRISNDEQPIVDKQSWKVNTSRSVGQSPALNVAIDGTSVNLNAVPFDYEIEIGPMGIDTSFSLVPSRQIPTNFRIWDVTEPNLPMKVAFTLTEPANKPVPGQLRSGDVVEIKAGKTVLQIGSTRRVIYTTSTWKMSFSPSVPKPPSMSEDQYQQMILPQTGDRFLFTTKKPFDRSDIYEFTVIGHSIDEALESESLDNIYVVPDPYIAASSLEPRLVNQSGRGERKIEFVNLPTQCRIRIFTVSGRLVADMAHSSSDINGRKAWDMRTVDGLEASFGVYIYQVDAPGIGTKIGRFAIIK